MPFDWRKLLGIKGLEVVQPATQDVVPKKSPAEERRERLTQKRSFHEGLLIEKGFSVSHIQDSLERLGGFTTDDIDVFEYAQAHSQLIGIPVVHVSIEPSTTLSDILKKAGPAMQPLLKSDFKYEEPCVQFGQSLGNLNRKVSLCVVADDTIGSRPVSQDLRDFQDIARAHFQSGKLNLVTYCSNLRTVPIELAISVGSITLGRRKKD